MRYKLTIEYDGTDLLGWQRQLDGSSVQEHLENAIFEFYHQQIEVTGAGRTDAGVHATAQVAHVDLETNYTPLKLREAINAHLRFFGSKVSVINVEKVSDDFHARFSATSRGYVYKILNRRAHSPLLLNRVWWVPVALDAPKMRQASVHLLGNHDFSSFRASACQALSPIKTLDKIEINTFGDEIHFGVEAKSFLHHQVRNIVGTLKMVGEGRIKPDSIKDILEAKSRSAAGATAPACGLYLTKVNY